MTKIRQKPEIWNPRQISGTFDKVRSLLKNVNCLSSPGSAPVMIQYLFEIMIHFLTLRVCVPFAVTAVPGFFAQRLSP